MPLLWLAELPTQDTSRRRISRGRERLLMVAHEPRSGGGSLEGIGFLQTQAGNCQKSTCINVLCRAITSTQIAKATEAERAEARSLSANRRQKLKLELGETEGISTLLENSLLGATGETSTNF